MSKLSDRARSKMPDTPIGWVVLTLGATAWIYLLFATGGDLLAGSVWSVPFLLLMAAVTTPWRSLPFRNLAGLFLTGFGAIFMIALAVQWLLGLAPIDDAVRSLLDTLADAGFDLYFTRTSAHLWAPITEEALKVLPVLLLMRWRVTSFKTLAGPIDYAVVAGATGAGFAYAEDVLVLVSPNALTHPADDSFGLWLGQIYQNVVGADEFGRHIGSTYSDIMSIPFPEMQLFSGAIWVGHGALAFAIGLAIGMAVWLVRRSGQRAWYLLPIFSYLWATWEHVLGNWYGGAGCNRRDLPLCALADIDLRGRIFPFVILAGFGIAIYLSRAAIGKLRTKDPHLRLQVSKVSTQNYRSDGWRGWLALTGDLFEFFRMKNATAYGADSITKNPTGRRLDALALLATRTRALTLRRKLLGMPVEAPPEGAKLIMDRAAPFH